MEISSGKLLRMICNPALSSVSTHFMDSADMWANYYFVVEGLMSWYVASFEFPAVALCLLFEERSSSDYWYWSDTLLFELSRGGFLPPAGAARWEKN